VASGCRSCGPGEGPGTTVESVALPDRPAGGRGKEGEMRITYTVRAPGHTAWEEGLRTKTAAARSLRQARAQGLQARAYRETPDGPEDVTDEVDHGQAGAARRTR
jgi:hypothetical protein